MATKGKKKVSKEQRPPRAPKKNLMEELAEEQDKALQLLPSVRYDQLLFERTDGGRKSQPSQDHREEADQDPSSIEEDSLESPTKKNKEEGAKGTQVSLQAPSLPVSSPLPYYPASTALNVDSLLCVNKIKDDFPTANYCCPVHNPVVSGACISIFLY